MKLRPSWHVVSAVGIFVVASVVALGLLLGEPTSACAASLQIPCGYGRLTGKVTDSDTGVGLSGASVFALSTSGADYALSTLTQADGTYTLDLPMTLVGQQFLVSAQPGFTNQRYLSAGESVATEVFSGTSTSLDFALDVGATIAGVVTSAKDSSPITGTIVNAFLFDPELGKYLSSKSTTVDASGVYTLEGLSSGSYALYYATRGVNGQYMSLYTDGATSLADVEPIVLTAPQAVPQTVQKNIALGIGAVIEGVILRADDSIGVESAGVYLSNVANDDLLLSPQELFALTNVAGQYVLVGVPPGEYRVRVNPNGGFFAPENSDLLGTFYGDTRQKAMASLVTVAEVNLDNFANRISAIDVNLPVGASIRGTVVDAETNAPLADVTVIISQSLNLDLPKTFLTVRTDASGVYTATGHEDGVAEVLFSGSTGYLDETYRDEDAESLITLSVGATVTGVDGALDKASQLSGRVTDLEGNPIANVFVTIAPIDDPDSQEFGAFTRSDGSYLRLLPPGEYTVRFSRNIICGCYNREFYMISTDPENPATVEVGAAAQVTGIDVELACGTLPPVATEENMLFMPILARP